MAVALGLAILCGGVGDRSSADAHRSLEVGAVATLPSDVDFGSAVLTPRFSATDAVSVQGQHAYNRASAARLALGITAATTGAFASVAKVGNVEILGLVAAAAFAGALIIELWLLHTRPETAWYEGRAFAESARTLAWRYAVGGLPFPTADEHSDQRYRGALEELAAAAPVAQQPADPGKPTNEMSVLRASPLNVRVGAYVSGRVDEQRGWYSRKAAINLTRASQLKVAMLSGEGLGIGLALSKALGYVSVDVAGIAATAIGAGAAWLALRQYDAVARTYLLASTQLLGIAERLRKIADEEVWVSEVTAAEEAITREHAAWHAVRSDSTLHRPVRGHGQSPDAK